MKKLITVILSSLIISQTVSAAAEMTLTDVIGHKYQAAIEYLFQEGIIQGYPNLTFKPNTSINRAELTKIIVESAYDSAEINQFANTSCFPDVKAEDWYSRYVCFAKSRNIVSGYPDGNFMPANTINLNETLKIIYEGLKIPVPDENVIFKFKYYSPAAKAGYLPGDLIGAQAKLLTRGEVSEVLYRVIIDEDRIVETDINLGLKIVQQGFQASCGIAALATALSQQNDLTEDQIIQQMIALNMYPNNPVRIENDKLIWDDPQKVFVGDYDGLVSIYSNKLTGYGFLEIPLERLAKVWAPNSERFNDVNLQFFTDQLMQGHPVIVFATVNARNGAVIVTEPGPFNVSWSLDDGRTLTLAMYKHNMVIEGFRGTPTNPKVFYIIDPFYGNKIDLSPSQLTSLLQGYNFSGVVIKF